MEKDLRTRTDRFGVELRERVMWDIREGIVGSETFVPNHVLITTWKNVSFAGGIDNSLFIVSFHHFCLDFMTEISIPRQTLSKWFWRPMKFTLTPYSTMPISHGVLILKLVVTRLMETVVYPHL